MNYIIGKNAGFCFGVSNAVEKAKNEVKEGKKIYCLGELVHNKIVTQELEKRGIAFIENIEDAEEKVIIRAHGVQKEIYTKAEKLNLKLIDLTCPKVLAIHKIAEEYSADGYFILLIGQKSHPETIGTISFCGSNSFIIEEQKDIKLAIEAIEKNKIKKVLVISQTTFSVEKFKSLTDKIEKIIKKDISIEVRKTICNATEVRQKETVKIAKKVDLMIIVGGRHSSNTKKLYELSEKICNTILVEDETELKNYQIKENLENIGIMAGASTPKESIQKCIEIIEQTW